MPYGTPDDDGTRDAWRTRPPALDEATQSAAAARQWTARFEGQKLVAAAGSSGMGKEAAAQVVAGGGSAVIVGRDRARVNETVAELSKEGQAYAITDDLADRAQADRVRQQLPADHADATLLVNAAGIFILVSANFGSLRCRGSGSVVLVE